MYIVAPSPTLGQWPANDSLSFDSQHHLVVRVSGKESAIDSYEEGDRQKEDPTSSPYAMTITPSYLVTN